MSTMTSDCHRRSDFLMVSTFGIGFAMKFSSLLFHHREHEVHEENFPRDLLSLLANFSYLFVLFVPSWLGIIPFVLGVFPAAPYHGVHERRLAGLDLCDG